MSRFHEYDGDPPDSWNGGDLWTARARLALEGKRGRAALGDLRDALLALPEKKLIEGALCTVGGADRERVEIEKAYPLDRWVELGKDLETRQRYIDEDLTELRELVREQGEGVCAVGAYVWWQKVKAGMDPAEAFAALPTIRDEDGGGDQDTAEIGTEHGLTWTLAWELGSRNDEDWGGLTPEQRYVSFLAWIDNQLSKPPLKKAPPKVRYRRAKAVTAPRRAAPETVGMGL